MGCTEKKKGTAYFFYSPSLYQYHHMSDRQREPAELVGNLSAADSLLPKRFQYLWFQKRSGYCNQQLKLLSDSEGAPSVEF